MAATARPKAPGSRPTSVARSPSALTARATLTPFPPAVTKASSTTVSAPPGRNSAVESVRSIARLGPATRMSARMSWIVHDLRAAVALDDELGEAAALDRAVVVTGEGGEGEERHEPRGRHVDAAVRVAAGHVNGMAGRQLL